ncbi:hypothetical protein GJ631_07615 [Natronomonas sp. CBA1123]|uniref:DUF7502 family protein n=1 Tax=Natronomonas sp. CBA1123 TaxID=2668070 RepID=UPI0012EA79AB|nr:hypothetical protein [Natronomonas sp. CBA1123]MUV86438.1 hypothetical protein [Natronomonas sp. CBA1123]
MTDEESETETGAEVADDRPRERMAAALNEIRREGLKAATIYAAVDATLVFLAVNLLVIVVEPAAIPDAVTVPSSVTDAVGGLVGQSLGTVDVPVSALIATALAVVVFGAELWLRSRRPLVERFEAANPSVAEALRTARDTVARDSDSRMAARLYEDVLERLRDTSSVALLDVRRIAVTVIVVVALSLATVQLAAVDLGGGEGVGPDDGTDAGEDTPNPYTGLKDGDAVLGDPEDVDAGDDELDAQIDSSGGSEDVDDTQQFPSDSVDRGSGGSNSADGQQAGYAEPEQLEDAELIREYNLRIRDEENT